MPLPAEPERRDGPRRVGLFGGTFDPPHVGHVRVARDVADELALDRVLWVPAGRPPHKAAEATTDAAARLAMVRAATAVDSRFEACRVEIDRPGPSYTIDTLRELRPELGDAEVFVILGVDQYRAFDSWREPERILEEARLAVMDRSGESARTVHPEVVARHGDPSRVVFVPVERVDVSSTEVRRAFRSGAPVSDLVPVGVAEVVEARGLYAD